MLDRPEPDEIDQHYISLFYLLNKTKSSEATIPTTADLFLVADTVLEDRLEFCEIMLAGFEALKEARDEKEGLNDELKKSG